MDVVSDEDTPLDELLEAWQDLGEGRGIRDHAVCYAGQAYHKLVYDLPAHELECSELRDGTPLPGRRTGGLHIEDDVRSVPERERAGMRRSQVLAFPDEPGISSDQPLDEGSGITVRAS